jgi:hypothetical protein
MKMNVVAICIAISLSTQAGAAQDRVYSTGTVPPWVTKAQKIGTADDSQRVLLTAYLSWRNMGELQQIPATSAELNLAYGVGVDASSNLYIADATNQRVREVTASTGIITTVAGTSNYGYNGDNIPATSAELFGPRFDDRDGQGNRGSDRL